MYAVIRVPTSPCSWKEEGVSLTSTTLLLQGSMLDSGEVAYTTGGPHPESLPARRTADIKGKMILRGREKGEGGGI